MSKNINDCVLELREKALKAIKLMAADVILTKEGVTGICINETKRDLAVQMAYYSRSRMKDIEDVKAMYKAAGLYTPTNTECLTKNTNTLSSKHIDGKAIDLVPLKNGKLWWDAPDSVWKRMGEIGKSCGLIWGGDFKGLYDTPHFEI